MSLSMVIPSLPQKMLQLKSFQECPIFENLHVSSAGLCMGTSPKICALEDVVKALLSLRDSIHSFVFGCFLICLSSDALDEAN